MIASSGVPSRQITFGTKDDEDKIKAPEFGDSGEELIVEEADAAEGDLQKCFDKLTFVVGSHKLETRPNDGGSGCFSLAGLPAAGAWLGAMGRWRSG